MTRLLRPFPFSHAARILSPCPSPTPLLHTNSAGPCWCSSRYRQHVSLEPPNLPSLASRFPPIHHHPPPQPIPPSHLPTHWIPRHFPPPPPRLPNPSNPNPKPRIPKATPFVNRSPAVPQNVPGPARPPIITTRSPATSPLRATNTTPLAIPRHTAPCPSAPSYASFIQTPAATFSFASMTEAPLAVDRCS